MKKCLCMLLTAVIVCSAFPFAAMAAEKGDADNDGIVSIDDVTYIQKVLSEIETPAQNFYSLADFNGDGNVTIEDATEIQYYLNSAPIEPSTSTAETTTQPDTSVTVTTEPTTQMVTESTEPSSTLPAPTKVTEPATTEPFTTAATTQAPVTEPTTAKTYPTYLNINRNVLDLGTGESYNLNAKTDVSDAVIDFSSDNNSVATVASDGTITAHTAGIAVIKCETENSIVQYCTVTVQQMAYSLSLNATNITLYVGQTFDINSYIPSSTMAYYRLYSSSDSSVATVAQSGGLVTAKKVGTCIAICTLSNGITATCNIYVMPESKKLSGVPLINQNKLPTGCETCSAAMVLQYNGFYISETSLADNYIIQKPFTYSNNKYYGPDPNSAFVGSPYSSYSFGAYAPVMAKCMNNYLAKTSCKAVFVKGENLDYLCGKYVAQGQPVMVWATINMLASYKSTSWTINYIDENSDFNIGDTFTWTANEHCLVLTGYDSNNYYFNDPWTNSYAVYSKSLVNTRYSELGKQAIAIETK